ncbi:GtrA family protein [Legionella tucsonensis]|uniref:O antigen biosynthesis protein n=1 Tax=Legionella tucsonensis TaxID=40335 RepID=A0A0W0ZSS7_9GAMM|nr:GtrA family protein [Legionella tucsonensis]KTD72251.1 O antigen biosynthesis protein [Legionella tucsonensis]
MQIIEICCKLDNHLFRFILIGGINTFISYLLFLVLIKVGFYYIYAISITWCVGLLFNFRTIGKWVFNNNDKKPFVKFMVLYGFIYLLSIVLLRLINGLLNNLSLSGIVTILIASSLSFLGNRSLFLSSNQYENADKK